MPIINSKKFSLLLSFCLSICFINAQWTTSGTDIYNTNSGNIGIGTPSPQFKLHVKDSRQLLTSPTVGGTAMFEVIDNPNYAAGQYILFGMDRDGTTGFATHGAILSTGNNSGGNSPLILHNWDNAPIIFANSNTERMRINTGGNVGIGTTSPSEMLSVKGTILSLKVKVVSLSNWYDYVFDEGYKLPTLPEIEKYIKQHKHLPDIPSAKEVEEKGLDLGDTQALMLKKIEELTLYLIEQNKKVDEQSKRITEQDEKIKKLEEQLLHNENK